MTSTTKKVKAMRSTIVAFVKASGGAAERSKIKTHLGIEPMAFNSCLEKALKTTKLIANRRCKEIGPGLYIGPYIHSYSLSK